MDPNLSPTQGMNDTLEPFSDVERLGVKGETLTFVITEEEPLQHFSLILYTRSCLGHRSVKNFWLT